MTQVNSYFDDYFSSIVDKEYEFRLTKPLSIKNYTSDHAILKKGVHLYKQMPWRLHDTPRLHENRTEKGERKDTAVYFNRVPLIGLGPWGIINS